MHIAVVPHSHPSKGGAHQYSLAVLDALSKVHSEDEYTLLVRSACESEDPARNVRWRPAILPLFTRERLGDLLETSIGEGWLRDMVKCAFHQLVPAHLTDPDRVWRDGAARRFLKRNGVDWTFYTTPNAQSFETGLPFVMPVFDLQHRLQPQFPEVSANGEWDRREYLYRNGMRQATLILADSEVGKEDILTCYGSYGITADRVRVLPYVAPPYLASEVAASERTRVRTTYALPERYLFYPAQLWPHKNHVRLIQALGQLKADRGLVIPIVCCGASSGAIRTQVWKEMMQEAERLGVTSQIHYLRYVPNEAMSALYAEAMALVMPTFFGPTNIPIVEAWLFNCPVLTSDLRGIREQVGDAGLLVNPRSVEALANGIRRLWEDEALRTELAQRGRQHLARYNREDFCTTVADIVSETKLRVKERSLSRVIQGNYRVACT